MPSVLGSVEAQLGNGGSGVGEGHGNSGLAVAVAVGAAVGVGAVGSEASCCISVPTIRGR